MLQMRDVSLNLPQVRQQHGYGVQARQALCFVRPPKKGPAETLLSLYLDQPSCRNSGLSVTNSIAKLLADTDLAALGSFANSLLDNGDACGQWRLSA